jgi:hypothetical protein
VVPSAGPDAMQETHHFTRAQTPAPSVVQPLRGENVRNVNVSSLHPGIETELKLDFRTADKFQKSSNSVIHNRQNPFDRTFNCVRPKFSMDNSSYARSEVVTAVSIERR